MSEWIKIDKNKLPVEKEFVFKGDDWSEFTCKGRLTPKRKFEIFNMNDGTWKRDQDSWGDITHYRELNEHDKTNYVSRLDK